MRSFIRILGILLGLAFGLTGQAFSCMIPPSQYSAHHKELVQKAPTILLAKMIAISGWSDDYTWSYRFSVLERLKGSSDDEVTLRFSKDSRFPTFLFWPDPDFDSHKDPAFWDGGSSKAGNTPACAIDTQFRLGGTYLLFLGHDHYKGFERINSPDDKWLQAVRSLLANPSAQSGQQQTVWQFLDSRGSILLATPNDCLPEEAGNADQDYKITRVIRGNIPDELPSDIVWNLKNHYRKMRRKDMCKDDPRQLIIYSKDQHFLTRSYTRPAVLTVLDGQIDFQDHPTEIELIGPTKVPLEDIIRYAAD